MIASLLAVTLPVRADSAVGRECRVKAAFVYNFIKFIDFPDEKTSAHSKSITVGLLGSGGCSKTFGPIKNKQVKGKNLVIKQLGKLDKLKELQKKNDPRWKKEIEAIKKYQVLFVCSCADKKQEIPVEILKELKDSGILTIGEVPGFLENGGVINFVMENKKVRFEINTASSDRHGLKIRSQLLKLARRVIKKEGKEE
jgi:hypothetical protein